MLYRRLITLFLLLIVFLRPHAQVNLQTGSAAFSLPMFDWQDDKSRLTAMVSLSYNSGSGLKVNDIASNVGQGWNLLAGGVVTRMQMGEPDDQIAFPGAGDQSDQDITKYPAGYFYSGIPASAGCPSSLTRYPLYKGQNQLYVPHNNTVADKQLDYFAFQFNGKGGTFILDTTGGDHGIMLGDSKIKIAFKRDPTMVTNTSTGIRTTITSFTIQDVDGLTYVFAQHGLTEILQQTFCDKNMKQAQTQPTLKSPNCYYRAGFANPKYINPWIIGSWYLTEIDDSLTGRKVLFSYNVNTCSNVAGAELSYSEWHDYSIIDYKTSVTKTPDISSISMPDGHLVNFHYGAARVDYNGEYALDSVDVLYNSRYLSRYIFNKTYFILNSYGTPVNTYQKKVARLCLKSVQKIGVDLKEDSPPYLFDYYCGSSNDDVVPPPYCWAKDIWGFYNGNNSVNWGGTPISLTYSYDYTQINNAAVRGLCFRQITAPTTVLLNPKPGYAQNGLLKQIVYPTGGSLTYSYAQNTGAINATGSDVNVGGVHVSQTVSADAGFSNGCANPITTSYNYVLNGAGSASSLWGIEQPLNTVVSGSYYSPEQKGYHWTWSSLPFGQCFYHYMYPGILSQTEQISISEFQYIMNVVAAVSGVLTVVTDVMDFVNLFADWGPSAIVAVVIDIVGGLVNIYVSCTANYTKQGIANTDYNSNLNDVSPLPMQFKRVEVVENPGTIGKTVSEFTNDGDFPMFFSYGMNPDLTARQRFAPWAYGLVKDTKVFDASGNLIKMDSNVYQFPYVLVDAIAKEISNPGYIPPHASCKCGVQYTVSERYPNWTNPALDAYNVASFTNNPGSMTVDFYGVYSGRAELENSYHMVYHVGDATKFVQSITSYFYHNTYNYDPYQINTVQSNGDVEYKNIKYSGDYSAAPLTTMLRYNMVSVPISTSSYVIKAGGGTNYLNEKVTEFTQLGTGDIKPGRILEQRFTTPNPAASMTFYGGPGSNTSNYKVPQTFTYDSRGNLIGLQDEGIRTVTNIYDYNDKFIVGSVINANAIVDKPAYTSFETASLGGWTLTGTGAVYSQTAITGSQSLILNGNTLSASLNTARPYILSFWANNSGVAVTGGSLTKSGPSYNGFTYFEYAIAQGTATVSVSGNANIDELRIFPKTARMRTTTYDPLIGKTAECDENNRITYYQYDNLARLQFIRDESMNIIKMYEYNNISPSRQNGCPGSYSNRLISTVFTRSNCLAGYQGSDTVYTVPAGKYTSSTSQADADAQAQSDILTNGYTFANTYGTCNLIYYNVQQIQRDSTQICAEGYKGGWVSDTVPAGRYSSIISQADADQQAATELAANAQALANAPGSAICLISTDPDWYTDSLILTCQKDANNNFTGDQQALATDINPNSPTYNQTKYIVAGINTASCPPTAGSAPALSGTAFSQINATGVITGTPGAVINIQITLNSSVTNALLTGSAGASINLSGSGTHTVTNAVTVPAVGYISWNLTISGTPGTGGYVSSNISVH